MSRLPPNGHVHPEMWTQTEHNRFEDRLSDHLDKVEKAIDSLALRVTLLMGALGFVAFLVPIIAPFVRALLNIDPPPGQ